MKAKLSKNLVFRVDENLKKELTQIQEKAGCPISEIVRQCLESLVEYYKANGCLVLPVVMIPEKELATLRKRAGK